ncbi:MAG: ACP phosphodiesterase [Agriterribacter sp.]
MNYLAHAYLSFNHSEILVGNMISDFVKGKQKETYTTGIYKGIMLHREIDSFTDAHPATAKAKEFFRPAYRLYSGAFIDIVYDHFLANDNVIFSEKELMDFSQETYSILDKHNNDLPLTFKAMLPYMKQHNWLFNYRYKWGIKNSFSGLVRRAKFINDSSAAFEIFEKNYTALQQCYAEFIPEIILFARRRFNLSLL